MAPENTAPAFDFGVHYGADVLEIDVRLNRDGEVIVTHDETVDRTTNGSGKVADFGLSALKRLDASYRFDHAAARAAAMSGRSVDKADHQTDNFVFDGGHVQLLTLGELYSMYPRIRINIDVKDNSEAALNAVIGEISRHEAADRSVVASFHDAVLRHCRKQYPWITTSAGMADVKQFYWWYLQDRKTPWPGTVKLFQLPVRYFFLPLASRRFIEAVHRSGAQVNYWTINQPSQMKQLIDKGADGLVTDRMDLASALIDFSYSG